MGYQGLPLPANILWRGKGAWSWGLDVNTAASPSYCFAYLALFCLAKLGIFPCLLAQLCPTLCCPMGCSPPDSSVHGIFQARILEWVAILFSRESSQPRDQIPVSCIAGRFLTVWATRKPSFCLAKLGIFPNSSNFDLCYTKPWISKIDCSFVFLISFLWLNILALDAVLWFWSKPSNLTFIPDLELDPDSDHLDCYFITSMWVTISIKAWHHRHHLN